METLIYEAGGRVARVTLNRPERGNGITPAMPGEIAACVERANLDPTVHAIALAGNGSGFCGGYDLVASAESLGGPLGDPDTPGREAEDMPETDPRPDSSSSVSDSSRTNPDDPDEGDVLPFRRAGP